MALFMQMIPVVLPTHALPEPINLKRKIGNVISHQTSGFGSGRTIILFDTPSAEKN